MSRTHLALLAALLALGSCAFPLDSETAVPVDSVDFDVYARDVHPLLEASCATLDCHGGDRRPLQLFAETGRRLRAHYRGELVQPDELRANVYALRTIDMGESDLDRGMLLLKPLARSAGGAHHVGGELWASRQHPGYVCLRAFLAREGDASGARQACVDAYELVKLRDREPL